MAKKVTAQQLGAQPKVYEEEDGIETVQDILDDMDLEGVSIKVNGQTQGSDYILPDYAFVTFGEKVKGGSI